MGPPAHAGRTSKALIRWPQSSAAGHIEGESANFHLAAGKTAEGAAGADRDPVRKTLPDSWQLLGAPLPNRQHSRQPILIPPDSPPNFQATNTAAAADLQRVHLTSTTPESWSNPVTRVVE